MKKKKATFLAWGIAAIVLVGGAVLFQKTFMSATAAGGEGGDAGSSGDNAFIVNGDTIDVQDSALSTAEIQIATVQKSDVPKTMTLTAKSGLDMDTVAHVSALFGGKVVNIGVELGQAVLGPDAPGGPTKLCVIESNDLAQDKANWLQALIQEKIDEQALARAKELFMANVLAEKFLIDAESQLMKDQSAQEAARQQLLIFGLKDSEIDGIRKEAAHQAASMKTGPGAGPEKQEKTTDQIRRERMGYVLTAPRSGVIAEKFVADGETAIPQNNLFTIADTRQLWVWGDVYERDLDQVKKGQHMKVYFTSEPTRARDCTVDWISPVLDPNTHSIKIRGMIDNADGHLLSDMYGTMVLSVGDGKDSLVVPADAVISAGNDAFVFVETGSAGGRTQFRKTPVMVEAVDAGFGTTDTTVASAPGAETGIKSPPHPMVRIARGLASGQAIVISGALGLYNEMLQHNQ